MENYQSCFQVQKFCLMFYVHISHFTKSITQELANFIQKYHGVHQSEVVSFGVECDSYLQEKVTLQI